MAGGTSGHLLGGALAAVLVGLYLGALCVTVVLAVQALLHGAVGRLGAATPTVPAATRPEPATVVGR